MKTEEHEKEKEKKKFCVCGQAIHGGNAVRTVAGPVGGIVVLWLGLGVVGW